MMKTMRSANDPQEYINLISLLEQSLKFYAAKDNYVEKHNVNNELCSMVELDGGEQAKFALSKIEEFNVRYDGESEIIEKYKISMDSLSQEDALKIINEMKKLTNEIKNSY